MGFLHKLWDDIVAGPTPDKGLGKLRKYDSFKAKRSPSMLVPADHDHEVQVTRSITILRRANSTNLGSFPADPSSLSHSPSPGSSIPGTPLTRMYSLLSLI